MFKRKVNASVVLQKQKCVISLPSDVWSEILRYFSRKQLCQQIHLVNRQLYNFASARHNVPNTHVIYRMSFQTTNRPRTFLNVFKSRRFNYIRFAQNCDSTYQHYDPKTLDTQQLRKMPIPKPFVCFQKVYIFRLLGESTLKFLRDAKESFVGSAIHYYMFDILDTKNMRNQMQYLFQNVFLKPSYISVRGSWLRLPELKLLTDDLPNCSRIKLWSSGPKSNEDAVHMLLDWISSGRSVAQNPQRESGKKHLILRSLPRRIILDMVQQIKDAFNDENWLLSDFVITCLASAENYDRLEGVHGNKFTLKKFSTNERLSLFTHSQLPFEGCSGRVYRLWYRRVVNEDEDLKMTIHLQNLVMWSRLRIDLNDREFYHFDYSREFSFAL